MAEASSSSDTTRTYLSPTQRYAAGGLFAIALHQAQIHHSRPLASSLTADDEGRISNYSSDSCESVTEDPDRWVDPNSGLLHPLFRFLEIDSSSWSGLEETAGGSPANHQVEGYLRLLEQDSRDTSQSSDQEISLLKVIEAVVQSLEDSASSKSKKEKHHEYEHECREKLSSDKVESNLEAANVNETKEKKGGDVLSTKDAADGPVGDRDEKPIEELTKLSYLRKVAVLYV